MLHTLYVALATLFLWETLRFAISEHAPRIYAATRTAHPLVVAILPLVVFWPDWIRALAVAGLVGIFHVLMRSFVPEPSVPTYAPRESRRAGLPPIP